MLPKQKEIELPLLEALVELGGQGKPKDIYPLVTKRFSTLREEDLAETVPSGENKWTNLIRWTKNKLKSNGEISNPQIGLWEITEKGRRRVETQEPPAPTLDFVELYDEYETAIHSQLLDRLNELTPRQFELFARKLLQAYGFVEVQVTSLSADGGIDGYGKLRVGLATMNAAFQCKRWQGTVGRPEVDKFRGAIQGEFEQGIFFATSDFSVQARDVSLKKGAVPVILYNGKSIIDLMIDKGIGVNRVPLYRYFERPGDLIEDEE